MAADRLVPDRVGEVYYLKYNPEHRWFVSPAMSMNLNSRIVDFGFFVGFGYPHKQAQSHLHLLCMTLKAAIMPGVRRPLSL